MAVLFLVAVILGMIIPATIFRSTEEIANSWIRLMICAGGGLLCAWALTYTAYLQFLC